VAIRTYRDTHGRARYAVEFQQAGNRVLRRLPPTATKAEAQALETKLRGEIFRVARLGQTPEISLEEAILRWLQNTLSNRKDQRKPVQNARLLAPFVAGKSLRQVPEAAREASNSWIGKSLTPATINRRLCVLKAAAKYAWKQGWIDQNLSGRITLLREDNKREVYLTAAQVQTLAQAAPSKACGNAIIIAAYSGLRVSELLAMPAISSRMDTLTVTQSKTGKPRRVPISAMVRPYLSALPLGLSYDQLRIEFVKARTAAKMPHVRFHDLRHTFASMLINQNVDLYTVGQLLGHSAPITTARYAHLSQASLKRAVGKLK